jgi:Flp pilus assembly protein TadG
VNLPRLITSNRGAYTIEAALVLPVITMILSGVVDYGRYFNERIAVVTAVREGARLGSTTDMDNNPTQAAITETTSLIGNALNIFDPTVTAVVSGVAPDQILTVTATFDFDPLIGLVALPSTVNSQLQVRMDDQ